MTILLQRLETNQHGLIQELIAGVEADKDALPAQVENRQHIENIFEEALVLLERADAHSDS